MIFTMAHPTPTFPLGHIQMLGKADANMFKADAPFFTPKFILKHLAFHSIDFWLTTEDLPDPNNRVMLTNEGHIQLNYTENNTEGHVRLRKKLKMMLNKVGVKHRMQDLHAYFGKKIPLAGVGHQNGTVRFGKDPKTSVLDLNYQSGGWACFHALRCQGTQRGDRDRLHHQRTFHWRFLPDHSA